MPSRPSWPPAACTRRRSRSARSASAVTTQVLDNLVWRSTPRKESSSAVRIRATEALSLLRDPVTIPHLFSIGAERVRPSSNGGRAEFELSGLRHAAIQVLLTMPEETAHFVEHRAESPSAGQTERALKTLIDHWRGRRLRQPADDVPHHCRGRPAGHRRLRPGHARQRREPGVPLRRDDEPAGDRRHPVVDRRLAAALQPGRGVARADRAHARGARSASALPPT